MLISALAIMLKGLSVEGPGLGLEGLGLSLKMYGKPGNVREFDSCQGLY